MKSCVTRTDWSLVKQSLAQFKRKTWISSLDLLVGVHFSNRHVSSPSTYLLRLLYLGLFVHSVHM